MSKYITLQDAKNHLRVDFDDDDIYIQGLVDMVEEFVLLDIQDEATPALENADGKFPKQVIHAMLILLGHFYMLREPVVLGVNVNKVPFSYNMLISAYKTYNIVR